MYALPVEILLLIFDRILMNGIFKNTYLLRYREHRVMNYSDTHLFNLNKEFSSRLKETYKIKLQEVRTNILLDIIENLDSEKANKNLYDINKIRDYIDEGKKSLMTFYSLKSVELFDVHRFFESLSHQEKDNSFAVTFTRKYRSAALGVLIIRRPVFKNPLFIPMFIDDLNKMIQQRLHFVIIEVDQNEYEMLNLQYPSILIVTNLKYNSYRLP